MRSIPCLLLSVVVVGACSSSQVPTLEEYGKSSLGLNVDVIRQLDRHPNSYAARINWQYQSYTLGNGHWVYVSPDRPNCEIHFEINSKDVIVGYTPVGTGCRYQ